MGKAENFSSQGCLSQQPQAGAKSLEDAWILILVAFGLCGKPEEVCYNIDEERPQEHAGKSEGKGLEK